VVLAPDDCGGADDCARKCLQSRGSAADCGVCGRNPSHGSFLHIHGPIHGWLKSRILVRIVATLEIIVGVICDWRVQRVQGRGKAGQTYGRAYELFLNNCGLLSLGGDLSSPLSMLSINTMWLAADLWRALRRPMSAAQ